MHLADQAAALESSRRTRFPSLQASWSAHIDRPAIPALSVLGSCLLFYVIGSVAGDNARPEILARLFALPPLDSYGDLSLVGDRSWLLIGTLAARAAIVTTVVVLVAGNSLHLRNVGKVALINIGATLSIFIFIALGWIYVAQKSNAVLSGDASPMLPALLLLQIFGYVAVCAVFAPMICKAAAAGKVRVSLLDPAIWLLSAASVWIWFFAAKRIEAIAASGPAVAFALALFLILIQSLLVGTMAIRTTRSHLTRLPTSS
jgi:hypothetical protein